MALSLRRADSVRSSLISGGVSADKITVAGRGESEPAVPTADGVREPKNRRVEIILQP
jgi:outer membrane protein OmpA-like peptidoglycan-associated protein